MKLIASSLNPLEKATLEMYGEISSPDEKTLILFPEDSFNISSKILSELSKQFNLYMVGTRREDSTSQVIAYDQGTEKYLQSSYPEQEINPYYPIPNKQKNNSDLEEVKFFENDNIYITKDRGDEQSLIARVCSDANILFSKQGHADLLLIPSAIQHPISFLKKSIQDFSVSLNKGARVLYAAKDEPLVEGMGRLASTGIYALDMKPLGEKKDNYCIY